MHVWEGEARKGLEGSNPSSPSKYGVEALLAMHLLCEQDIASSNLVDST